VNFPVGIYSHAILVDVEPDKVMLSDWNGDNVITNPSSPDYRNYRELIQALEGKYDDRQINFYPVDPYLKSLADIVSQEKGDAGGCSEYLYSWLNVYYRKGHYENPFI